MAPSGSRLTAMELAARCAAPVRRERFAIWQSAGYPPLLDRLSSYAGVLVKGALSERLRRAWVKGVYRAKAEWVSDFGGEQFALGRAFYTHLETDKSALYFGDAP